MRHVNGRESSREIAIISNNEKRFRRFKQNCALFYVTTGPAETSSLSFSCLLDEVVC